MTPRALLLGGLVGLAGCALEALPRGPDVEPEPDMGPPPDDCADELARRRDTVVGRCPDRATLRVAATAPNGAGAVLDGLGPAVVVDGQTVAAVDWPVILWTAADDVVTVAYSGHPVAPDVTLTLTPEDHCVVGSSRVAFGRGTLTRFDVLAQQGADADAAGLGRWTLTAAGVVDRTDAGSPWPGVRLFAGADRALAFAALDPDWPLLTTLDGPDAGLRASLSGPFDLGPEAGPGATWAICAADRAWDAVVEVGRRAADGLPESTHPPRSSVTHAVDPSDPDALQATAERITRAGAFGHLWLTGDWAADRADWTPRAQVTALVDGIAPATVGLLWPLLVVPLTAPLLIEHPEWIDAACDGDCPRLDPRIPAVREHLARLYLSLIAGGFEVRLTGLDHLAAADQRALLAALAVGEAPAPTLDPPATRAFPPVELGLSPALALPRAPAAETARQLASYGQLDDHLRIEGAVHDPAPDDAAALRVAIALALVGGHGRLPPLEGEALSAAIAPLTAYWRADPTAAMARPLAGRWFGASDPPPPAPLDWRSPRALILFNWSETPRVVDAPVELAPDLAGAPRLLQPDAPALGEAATVEIPPGDVVVWATVDGGPSGE